MGMIAEGPTSVRAGGREVALTVRRSKRARRIRLRVVSEQIELVLPWRDKTAMGEILKFCEDWLVRMSDKLEARRSDERDDLAVWVRGRHTTLGQEGLDRDGFAMANYREARRELPALVDKAAARTGLVPARVAVRDQASRWGSCSRSGTVSLNWRLIMAPEWVAEYVVVHELCHLRHMDHSPAFWGLVEHHSPDFRMAKAWMKAHGHELMRLQLPKDRA